ncbi:hypothetical protein BDZ89DRAFT_1072861 [Hymenopellis radicata]|nr:hypothetical protein BDZ89DRAFT_1072861 [Hymenopellis radicata]
MSIPGVSCPNCGHDSTNVLPSLFSAPSPFQHLFDYRASPEQISAARPQINSFIHAVRDELYDAEARVARLREALQAAEQTHAKVKGVLDAHVMLNPPVQSLPPEILSYIFSLSFEKPFRIFESRMLWRLGQVCRHWRALARQTTSLWNSFAGRDSLRRDFYGSILEEVLNRSGDTPLHVSLDGLTLRSARMLARHASRLSELQVKCSFDILSAFKAAPEMSILTKLCLNVDHIFEPHSGRVYFDIAFKAPRLTYVVLNVVFVSVDLPRALLLPWPQITRLELELGTNNYQYIIDILSQCLNLVSFTDSYRHNPHRVSTPYLLQRRTPSSIYVFPRLTFLAVCSPLAILSYMQCPALQTFALGGFFQHTGFIDTDWMNLRAFLDRSRCTLQEVRLIPEDDLNNSTFFSAPLQKFLAFVSHVQRVEIDSSSLPNVGWKGIINREDNVIAFPELQVLTLKANAWVFLDSGVQSLWGLPHQQHVEDELIGAVESRWRVPDGAVRIRMARIELSMEIDFEDPVVKVLYEKLKGTKLLKKMKILKDEGLDVSVVLCVRWCYHDLIVKESTMKCL